MLDHQYPATPSALSGHWRYPCFNENWKRSRPLVVAMRTASRRNASVYLFAILYLLHSKHCSKETETKPRQDQPVPIYQEPNTRKKHPQHKIWPYLLKDVVIERPNHVWCAAITYKDLCITILDSFNLRDLI